MPPASSRLAIAARILAIVGAVFFLGAVLVYEDPDSFYTNFVLVYPLALMGLGAVINLVAIGLALASVWGPGRKTALQALAIAVLVPFASFATIVWVLRD